MSELGEMTRDAFEKAIIAQDDDCDYSESGYVALNYSGICAIARYSHCSCYGTFDALCGGGISDWFDKGTPSFDWIGTPQQLIELAEKCLDPAMPDRPADKEDYDYDHLQKLYEQVLAIKESLLEAK